VCEESYGKHQVTIRPLQVFKTVEDSGGKFVIVKHQDFKRFEPFVVLCSRPERKKKILIYTKHSIHSTETYSFNTYLLPYGKAGALSVVPFTSPGA